MRTFLYPGSFDPPTLGHVDIALRASKLCDCLVIAVMENAQKNGRHCFGVEERVAMLQTIFESSDNIRVVQSGGLLVDLYKKLDACAVVRGVRSMSDMENESFMAAVNQKLGGTETIFLPCRSEFSHISSSVVREILSYSGDVSCFVPEKLLPLLDAK